MPDTAAEPPAPPQAARRPTVHETHGHRRQDDYAWLRDREDPAVLEHLRAENAYTEAVTAHLEPLREQIYGEILARVVQTDDTYPVRRGDHVYWRSTVEGLPYPIHRRRAPAPGAADEMVLDVNALAEGHDYCSVGDIAVSPDGRLLAYTVDHSGAEVYTLRIRDLGTGEDRDAVEGVYYSLAWSAASDVVLYTRPDATMRPWQVWRHRIGTAAADDALVLQEDDERFFADVRTTKTRRLMVISLESKVTTEVWLIDAANPDAAPRLVEPRRQGVEYRVDHHGDRLLVLTNDEAPTFRLVEAPIDDCARSRWRDLVAADDGVTIDHVEVFESHLALFERAAGVRRVRVMPASGGTPAVVEQPEAVSTVHPGENPEPATTLLRFEYTSLVTPASTVEVDMETLARHERKRTPVRGYDPSAYVTERLWATAPDGERVPVSVVRRRDVALDGRAPLWLEGYGAYEISSDPGFRPERVSLLDRGVVVAIAHVRGGGEMGRRWYLAGRMEHKRNSITDLLAAAEHLVASGYTSAGRIAVRGGSAGGLLVGAAVAMRPDLFGCVVALVPFVDVVTTMLDESLPLTATEWEEWGDPRTPDAYARMLEYSPYDLVTSQQYPPILATAGLNDPRVGFWEPAKWVARLRSVGRGGPFLLKTQLGAGHAGPSGRYSAWQETAFAYAFALDALGAAEPAAQPTR